MKLSKDKRIGIVREIIDRNKIDVPFSEEDLKEFCDACYYHVDGVVRRINPQFAMENRHLHMLIDNKWQPKSWRKLISPLSADQEVKRVMRNAVWKEMKDFFNSVEVKICEFCDSTENLTVDHIAPPFSYIADEFIDLFGTPEVTSPPRGEVVWVFVSDDERKNWVEFHSIFAEYQILCRSCNARKGAK